jgi:hypothetical protein
MKISIVLIIAIIFASPWLINAYKFANCDFKSDYKCEAIHGIGIIIPPTALITFWFGSDA